MAKKYGDIRDNIVDNDGDMIVSASAGSGKTTVMIERLVRKIIGKDVSLDNVLAMTFTDAAADNMKDRLRSRIGNEIADKSGDIDNIKGEIDKIDREIGRCTSEKDIEEKQREKLDKLEELNKSTEIRDRLARQYNLIPSADISTIDSFCLNLIKKYFYLTDFDANSDVLDDKSPEAAVLRERAFDNLFNGPDGKTGYYGETDENGDLTNVSFRTLLNFLRSNRSDDKIREDITESYGKVRQMAGYRKKLFDWTDSYAEDGFKKLCDIVNDQDKAALEMCLGIVEEQEPRFTSFEEDPYDVAEKYTEIFAAMKSVLQEQETKGVFGHPMSLDLPDGLNINSYEGSEYRKLNKDKGWKDIIKKLKSDYTFNVTGPIKEIYATITKKRPVYDKKHDVYKRKNDDYIFEGQTCRKEDEVYAAESTAYLEAGKIASAFCQCILDFDDEYAKVKRDEHKLDYADMEQTALALLKNQDVKAELNKKYKFVFVDEYQDINPIQDEILECLKGEKFYVGDVKQAIYAFRGSRSKFFSNKFERYNADVGKTGTKAYKMYPNYRSKKAIIDSVNRVFDVSMTREVCDIDYEIEGHDMTLPKDGKNSEESGASAEYGTHVHYFNKRTGLSDEVPDIYSVTNGDTKTIRDANEKAVLKLVKAYLHPKEGKAYEAGDICVLARKGKRVRAVAKKLEEEGIPVAETSGGNILQNSEIRQILDILSYIDNCTQDIPLIASMLSPIGNFTEDELAAIRLAEGGRTFKERVEKYANSHKDDKSEKIAGFDKRLGKLRKASEVLSAGALIDEIMREPGMMAKYSKYPQKLKSISLLASKGEDKTLSEFLKIYTAEDAEINMPAGAASDGVNVMTMHHAKGLEFPVVIICDANERFNGWNEFVYLFDDEWGFAFKYHNSKDMTRNDTLLWTLVESKQKKEEISNELNLFYVACTRAKERLDIVTSKRPDPKENTYSVKNAKNGNSYSDIIDLLSFDEAYVKSVEKLAAAEDCADADKKEVPMDGINEIEVKPGGKDWLDDIIDESADCHNEASCEEEGRDFEDKLTKALDADFRFEYMNAPSKTSVTAAIRNEKKYKKFLDADAEADEKPDDDDEDEEGGAKRADGADKMEVGTAYHKFLELWDDPEVRDASGIGKMIDGFVESGQMTERQRDILRDDFHKDYSGPAAVAEVIYNKVYKGRMVEKAYHERRFLCNLPVEHVYEDKYRGEGAAAGLDDMVLVQGTIDLLVRYDGGKWHIFDYKYSEENEKKLYETYHRQLELYAEAAKKILGLNEETAIETELVNINPRI